MNPLRTLVIITLLASTSISAPQEDSTTSPPELEGEEEYTDTETIYSPELQAIHRIMDWSHGLTRGLNAFIGMSTDHQSEMSEMRSKFLNFETWFTQDVQREKERRVQERNEDRMWLRNQLEVKTDSILAASSDETSDIRKGLSTVSQRLSKLDKQLVALSSPLSEEQLRRVISTEIDVQLNTQLLKLTTSVVDVEKELREEKREVSKLVEKETGVTQTELNLSLARLQDSFRAQCAKDKFVELVSEVVRARLEEQSNNTGPLVADLTEESMIEVVRQLKNMAEEEKDAGTAQRQEIVLQVHREHKELADRIQFTLYLLAGVGIVQAICMVTGVIWSIVRCSKYIQEKRMGL